MIDAKSLFIPTKRYRGLAPFRKGYVLITFNVTPLNEKEVRLRNVFPSNILEKLKNGDVIYTLIEGEKKLIAELRVLRIEGKSIVASLDFLVEDRRKLPRVKVKGLLDVEIEVRCLGITYKGNLVDLSLSSLSVNRRLPKGECELTLSYKDRKINLKGKVVRTSTNSAVEITDINTEITDFLGEIYSDLFLKVQRS